MTVEEWLHSADALSMLQRLFPMRGPDSAVPMTRRTRLYLVAIAEKQFNFLPWCCRQLIHAAKLDYDVWPPRVGLAAALHPLALSLPTYEAHPDDWDELDALVQKHTGGEPDGRGRKHTVPELWGQLARLVSFIYHHEVPPFAQLRASYHNADLVREIFTGLALWVPFEKEWRNEDVQCLAEEIYTNDRFENLPMLADALEEAGCNQPLVLDHCRDGNQKHCRGCWVVDLARGEG